MTGVQTCALPIYYEGTFPYNLESLRLTFCDMPETRRRKLLGQNAAKLYGFDLAALQPLVDQYGPTVAEVARPLTELPEKPNEALLKGVRRAS